MEYFFFLLDVHKLANPSMTSAFGTSLRLFSVMVYLRLISLRLPWCSAIASAALLAVLVTHRHHLNHNSLPLPTQSHSLFHWSVIRPDGTIKIVGHIYLAPHTSLFSTTSLILVSRSYIHFSPRDNTSVMG